METLALSVQSETGGLESADEALQSETAAAEPLITGPAPYLWAGVGSVLLIFIVGMMLIIRGRVVRARPKRKENQNRSYFEPAGEDAEITFDDHQPSLTDAPPADHWRDDKVGETEVTIRHGDHDNGSLMDDDEPHPAKEEPLAAPPKKKSAFAGLFSKTPEPEPVPSENDAPDTHIIDEPGFFQEEDQHPEEQAAAADAPTAHYADVSAVQTPPQRAAASDNSSRIEDAEDAARQALRRAEDAEALARDLKRANDEAQNVMTLGLRRHEAALDERAEALMLMEKRLADLSGEFEERLHEMTLAKEALAQPTYAQAAHQDPNANLSEAHFAEFADLMGEQFDTLRGSVNAAIEKLSKRLDQFPASAAPVTATAARIQLVDLLRDVLAPKRYKLAHKLSSGRTADAAITMPAPMAPIAVDARFPVEAFDAWQMSRNAGTEMELRRAVLRNIADAGEKLIAPSETADCAMMFVPSEQILAELHAHFSDVVQESYRARVWMVAPTSLMATLHTISAVMAGAGVKNTTAANMMDELQSLRTRVAALEAERAAQKSHEREPHLETDRPPPFGAPAQSGDLPSPMTSSVKSEGREFKTDLKTDQQPEPASTQPMRQSETDERSSPFPLR